MLKELGFSPSQVKAIQEYEKIKSNGFELDISATYDPIDTDALSVKGRYIMKDGAPFRIQGVSLPDLQYENVSELLDTLEADSMFPLINTVRVPIHVNKDSPYTALSEQEFFDTKLKPVVDRITALGLYCIVDLHPIADWDVNETGAALRLEGMYRFWEIVAPLYADNPLVIYEFFNEPRAPKEATLENWKAFVDIYQPLVNLIRAKAPYNLIICGSPNWSSRTRHVLDYPFAGDNLAYTWHAYSNHGVDTGLDLADWLEYEVPQDVPVVFTEFGYTIGNEKFHGDITKNPNFPEQLEEFFDRYPWAGRIAWAWSEQSHPSMLATEGAEMKDWVAAMYAKPVNSFLPIRPLKPIHSPTQLDGYKYGLLNGWRQIITDGTLDDWDGVPFGGAAKAVDGGLQYEGSWPPRDATVDITTPLANLSEVTIAVVCGKYDQNTGNQNILKISDGSTAFNVFLADDADSPKGGMVVTINGSTRYPQCDVSELNNGNLLILVTLKSDGETTIRSTGNLEPVYQHVAPAVGDLFNGTVTATVCENTAGRLLEFFVLDHKINDAESKQINAYCESVLDVY